jgi:hypothetical protein
MPNPAREDAMTDEPGDLDDIDGSDLESEDDTEFEETDDYDDDAVEHTNTEKVLATPAPSVARMNLNTINLRTGGFAWFSA